MLKLRSLFITSILIFVLGVPASWATGSRVNSMGGGSKSITVDDESNFFAFPSTLVDNGNIAFADRLNASTGGFGLHYSLTKNAVFAIYGGNDRAFPWISRREPTVVDETPGSDSGNSSSWNSTDFKGAFGLALDLKSLKWGILLALYSADPPEDGDWGDEGLWGPMFGVDLTTGVGLKFGSSSLDLAVGLEFGSVTFAPENSDDQTDSHLGIKLGARMSLPVAPGVHAIPYLTMRYASDTVQEFSRSTLLLQAGADLRISPVKDVFIYPGVGLRYGTYTPEGGDSGTQIAIPTVSLAVDARITDWLDWRLGAVHLDISNSGVSVVKGVEEGQKVRFSTGFGMHFGDWSIDMHLDPQLFTEGVYLLTGDEHPWAMDAALKYAW